MEKMIRLEVLTPSSVLVEADVSEINAPGAGGEFDVLPGHTIYMSTLSAGELRYYQNGKPFYYAISSGIAEVGQDSMVILTEEAIASKDISVEKVERVLKQHRQDLELLQETDPKALILKEKISYQQAQLLLAGKVK